MWLQYFKWLNKLQCLKIFEYIVDGQNFLSLVFLIDKNLLSLNRGTITHIMRILFYFPQWFSPLETIEHEYHIFQVEANILNCSPIKLKNNVCSQYVKMH